MRTRGKPWFMAMLLALVIGLVPGMAIAEENAGGSDSPDVNAKAAAIAAKEKAARIEAESGNSLPLEIQSSDGPWNDGQVDSTISVDTSVGIDCGEGDARWLSFTPDVSGVYRFASTGDSGDPYGYLYDAVGGYLEDDDDSSGNSQFSFNCNLEAGKAYYLQVSFWGGGACDVSVSLLEEAPEAVSATFSSNAPLVMGDFRIGSWDDEEDTFYFNSDAVKDALEVTAVFKDGSSKVLSSGDFDVTYDSASWTPDSVNEVEVSYIGVTCAASIEVIDFATYAATEVEELTTGAPLTVSLTEGGAYFRFTPSEDGFYRFYSATEESEGDPYATLYVAGGEELASNDDGAGYPDFALRSELSAGQEYYLLAYTTDGETSTILAVERLAVPASLDVSVKDGAALFYGDPRYGAWEEYWDEESGSEYSYFAFYPSKVFDALDVTATSADGDITTLEYSDIDSLNYDYLGWNDDGTNLVTVSYLGLEESVEVPAVESPIVGIEFEPAEPYTLIMDVGTDTYYDAEGQAFDYYHVPGYRKGDKLILKLSDGTSVSYEWDGEEAFESADGDIIYYEDVERNDDQYSNHWTEPKTYYATIYFMNFTCDIPVTLIENPVQGIAYEPAYEYVLVEGVDGNLEWDEDDNEFFLYEEPGFNEGDTLTVAFTDGTRATYTYIYNEDDEAAFVSVDDEGDKIDPGDIALGSEQWDEHWIGTGRFAFTVTYLGRTCDYPATIIPNDIASISFTPKSPYVFYEGANGSWVLDDDDEKYFEYDDPYFEDGDELTVEYTDGKKRTYIYSEYGTGFASDDGEEIMNLPRWSSDQDEHHWTETGKKYQFQLTYSGCSCNVDVKLDANPIDHITYESAVGFKVIEGEGGYWTGNDEDDPDGYFSYDEPYFNEGDVLIVTYAAGESTAYTYGIVDEGNHAFVSANGDEIDPDLIERSSEQWDEHWIPGGENSMTIKYLGRTCEVMVTVVDASGDDQALTGVKVLIEAAADNPIEENVKAARAAVNELDSESKAKLEEEGYLERLEAAEKELADSQAAAEADAKAQAEADAAALLIAKAKEDLTEENVGAARSAYDALSAAAKAKLSEQALADLEAAEKELADSQAAAEADAKAQAEADAAAQLIAKAKEDPTEENAKAARSAFNALSAAAKAKLPSGTEDDLLAAEKAVEDGKSEVSAQEQEISAKDVKKTYGDKAFSLEASAKTALSFMSDNVKVATVDADGKVDILAAGTAKITITAAETAGYKGATKVITVTVGKAANGLSAKGKTVKAKAKKKAAFKKAKAFTIKNAQGNVTFKKMSGNKKITVNKKTGKITVKKGLKKGTYKVKVKVTAAGNANYNAASKTVTVKIKVK